MEHTQNSTEIPLSEARDVLRIFDQAVKEGRAADVGIGRTYADVNTAVRRLGVQDVAALAVVVMGLDGSGRLFAVGAREGRAFVVDVEMERRREAANAPEAGRCKCGSMAMDGGNTCGRPECEGEVA